MPDGIDLSVIADAFNESLLRDRAVVVAAVGADGKPEQSLRGSAYVYAPDQVALWARKRDEGLAVTVAKNPQVSIFYFDPSTSPRGIQIGGRARVEDSLSDEVYQGIPGRERDRDAEKKGVAIIVDVDYVSAFGPDGRISQSR